MFSIDYITGKKPLWRAFWLYGFLMPLIAAIALYSLASLAMTYDTDWHVVAGLLHFATFFTLIIGLFGTLAVWSCLNNTNRHVWKYLALAAMVAGVCYSSNEYVWLVHVEKGSVISQLAQAANSWLNVLIVVAIAVWLLRKQPDDVMKSRVIPALFILTVLAEASAEMLNRPYPTAFLIGENGDLKVKYHFTIRDAKSGFNHSYKSKLASLEAAAEHGDANAAFTLGSAYMDPSNPEANDVEAVRWLKYAIDHGVPLAKNELGILYHQGRGVEKSAEKALQLYKEGSEAGDDVATYNLGLMYELGQGTKRDYATAAKYYRYAVQRTGDDPDHGCAENDLGALYAVGKGVEQDDVEARSMFADAARKSFYILLKPKDINFTVPADIDFPNLYATYRLAVVKKMSPTAAGLSEKEIKIAKMVADRYQSRCRD